MVWDKECLEDFEQNDHSMNEWMNEWINGEGVYRTTPATRGLLNTLTCLYITDTVKIHLKSEVDRVDLIIKPQSFLSLETGTPV